MGNGIYYYESHMQNLLKEISEGITTLAWSFDVEELGEMQTTLAELSEYFDITTDIEKMIKSLRVGDYQ